jgi:hypothetical protein
MDKNDDREDPMKRFERALSRLLSDAADDGSLKAYSSSMSVERE